MTSPTPSTTSAQPAPASTTKPWEPERVIDAATALELVRPLVQAQTLAPLGAGWDNTAYLVDGTWVFRFPRRAIAVPLLERELAVLPELARHLPLPVTAPVHRGTSPDGWPFAGYRYLPGDILALALREPGVAAADALGRFVRALHAAPLLPALGPDVLGKADVRRRLAITEALAARHGSTLPDALVSEALAVPLGARPEVVVHGDLDARHVLVDAAGTVCGVIDWGDVHRGDPATDLALAFSALSGPARDAFFAAYGEVPGGAGTLAIARFRALHVALWLIDWAESEAGSDVAHPGSAPGGDPDGAARPHQQMLRAAWDMLARASS